MAKIISIHKKKVRENLSAYSCELAQIDALLKQHKELQSPAPKTASSNRNQEPPFWMFWKNKISK